MIVVLTYAFPCSRHDLFYTCVVMGSITNVLLKENYYEKKTQYFYHSFTCTLVYVYTRPVHSSGVYCIRFRFELSNRKTVSVTVFLLDTNTFGYKHNNI